ncbi:MAG: Fe-S metabolism associated SufE, partial [Planctomycetaceae bacterium]|nr:Fe-S metabolism associated SufE [Planctomycetaceae bacterium]
MKLDEYLAEFEGLDTEERLETLIDFGETLPPLRPEHVVLKNQGECRVQECQTEVFLHVAVADGEVQLAAYVPEKSPTVRGFVAMLVNGLNGVSPQVVLDIPDNMPERLQLQSALGMTRFRGFMGVVAVLKRRVREAS